MAGAKDDRRDAWVLADALRTDPAAFQAVQHDDPIIVQLRELSRAEDDLDGEFGGWRISCGVRCTGWLPRS